MFKNKKLMFVVTAVLFIVYTAGVIYETLRIGFDVLQVQPAWLDVILIIGSILVLGVSVGALAALIIQEHYEKKLLKVVINLPPLVEGEMEEAKYRDELVSAVAAAYGIPPEYFWDE